MSNKVAKNVGIILTCSIAAKVLSYLWEMTLAALLGASDQADAYYMVGSIAAILYPILDLGIWKVFLPTYKTKLVHESSEKANRLADIAITFFFCLSVGLVLFMVVFSKQLVLLIAPGFSPEKKALTAHFLRLAAPAYFLMASCSVIGAILQSHDRFIGSQIREIGTHVSKILFLIICYRFLGIYAAVFAMVVGSIFRLLIQLPFINWEWKFRPDFHFQDPEIVPMIKGLPSVALTAAIQHINSLIDRTIASGSASGSIACLNYGARLTHVFSGMVSTALGTASYPTMIQYIAQKREDKLRELIGNVLGALSFIIIPISVFCIVFSRQIVTVAFQRGAFDAAATQLTAKVFAGYCIGLLFTGAATIVSNIFYGYGDTKITLRISELNILLNIVFNLIFVRIWGVPGLAIATSLSAIICLIVRLFCLKRFLVMDYRPLVRENLKLLLLAVVSVTAAFLLFERVLRIHVYISLFCSFAVAAGLFLVLCMLLRIKAMTDAWHMIKARLPGRKRDGNKGEGGE